MEERSGCGGGGSSAYRQRHRGRRPVSFTIGPPPATASNAFVSAADPWGGNALAPGSIASFYGDDLAPQVAVTEASVSIALFAGRRDYDDWRRPYRCSLSPRLSSILNSAVYAQGSGVHHAVDRQGTSTNQLHGATEALLPALFTTNQGGTGQAATLIAGTASLAAPTAHPRSRPVPGPANTSRSTPPVWATLSNRPAVGAGSPRSPLSSPLPRRKSLSEEFRPP